MASLVAVAASGVVGCGGARLTSAGVYEDREARYQVGLPGEEWERIAVSEHNDLAWMHRDLGAVLQANASCQPSMDIPLRALTQHLLIGFTDRTILEQKTVQLARREALATRLRVKLDGVPRELILTVLKKNDCVYDFSLSAPTSENFSRVYSSYDRMLRDFRDL